jgi:hypothetical protein
VRDYVRTTLPQSATGAGVDCGHRYLVAKVGDSLDCRLTLGAQEKPFKVTVKDEKGTIAVAS